MRNVRADDHFRYIEKIRKNDNDTRKCLGTPKDRTPVTQNDDTSNESSKGTICIARDSILNGINETFLSRKRRVKVRLFPRATISNMYGHLKPILKQNPEYLIFHIDTNDTSKYIPNEAINKILDLKSFVESNANENSRSSFQHWQCVWTIKSAGLLFIRQMIF